LSQFVRPLIVIDRYFANRSIHTMCRVLFMFSVLSHALVMQAAEFHGTSSTW